jgi:hypothetical protein
MESIWHRLASLTQTHKNSEWDLGEKTQDLFLRLLSVRRFNTYIDENWSEEQINQDLLSLMQSQVES